MPDSNKSKVKVTSDKVATRSNPLCHFSLLLFTYTFYLVTMTFELFRTGS